MDRDQREAGADGQVGHGHDLPEGVQLSVLEPDVVRTLGVDGVGQEERREAAQVEHATDDLRTDLAVRTGQPEDLLLDRQRVADDNRSDLLGDGCELSFDVQKTPLSCVGRLLLLYHLCI